MKKLSDEEYKQHLDSYRSTLGIERSTERLSVGSQVNSDLSYRDAAQQYRSEQLSRIQATWLNTSIPWKVFCTLNVLDNSKSIDAAKTELTFMLKTASYRFRQIMSSAIGIEPFPLGTDVHIHCAVGSEANITVEWFDGYLNRFPELRHKVLPYSDPAILSYILKTTATELRNCEPYLKPPATSRERRRLRRMLSPAPSRLIKR